MCHEDVSIHDYGHFDLFVYDFVCTTCLFHDCACLWLLCPWLCVDGPWLRVNDYVSVIDCPVFSYVPMTRVFVTCVFMTCVSMTCVSMVLCP